MQTEHVSPVCLSLALPLLPWPRFTERMGASVLFNMLLTLGHFSVNSCLVSNLFPKVFEVSVTPCLALLSVKDSCSMYVPAIVLAFFHNCVPATSLSHSS